jgi:GAF domain-containing protein/HAMP domain-containing protein
LVQSLLTMGLLFLAAFLIFSQVTRLLDAINVLETAAERVRVVGEVRADTTALLGTISRLLPLQESTVFGREVDSVLSELATSQSELRALTVAEADDAMREALSGVTSRVDSMMNLSGTMILQAQEEQWPAVQVRVGVLNRDQQQVNAEIARLMEQVRARQQLASREVAAARQAVALYPGMVGLITLLVTVIAFVDINRRIGRPVVALTAGAGRLADGNFTERVQVDSNDEMGELAQAFNTMAAELQLSYGVLEERVQERTRDLALAAEVGQRLARVRDLEQLLDEAVRRIRDRFDLYYTQIYLVDSEGRNLVLHAGTGEVGAELVRRGFRLPIDRRSVNGNAVLEKEAVVIANTGKSALFRPNPLLPETRSEMAVPLLLGEQVFGVLDLQDNKADTLTREILPAFQVLAGQLAIAVENARLFSEVEAARREAAEAAQFRVRESWHDYLDAIERKEFIGFDYAGATVAPLAQPFASAQDSRPSVLAAPIVFNAEEIGAIELEAPADVEWNPAQMELVYSVAAQIGQQVENLRLLAEFQRYRDEAEAALQQVTAEGWASYSSAGGQPLAYAYESGEVRRANTAAAKQQDGLVAPLHVRGATIGELAAPPAGRSHEGARLINAVAERLSAHIDNLRLSRKVQDTLAVTEQLYEASARLNATRDLHQALAAVAESRRRPGIDRAVLFLLEQNADGELEAIVSAATWHDGAGPQPTPVGSRYEKETLAALRLLASDEPIFAGDVQTDERADAATRQLFAALHIGCLVVIPLWARGRQIGSLLLEGSEPRPLRPEEFETDIALAGQLAVTLDRHLLLTSAQRRAERERLINVIGQKIQSAQTMESAMHVALTELGQALNVRRGYVELNVAPAANGEREAAVAE